MLCPGILMMCTAGTSRQRWRGIVIGCLYLPNGNPAPGPKFEYKLRWLNRLLAHAAELLLSGAPVALAGDYNVIPTEADVYKPERGSMMRCSNRSSRGITPICSNTAGWIRCERFTPESKFIHSGIIFRNAYGGMLGCESTICS